MLSIFEIIAIRKNINKNKDNIQQFNYTNHIGDKFSRLYNNDDTSIEMKIEYYYDYDLHNFRSVKKSSKSFTLTYMKHTSSRIIKPSEQSLIDKIFVAIMYSKMKKYYIAKNGTPVNQS